MSITLPPTKSITRLRGRYDPYLATERWVVDAFGDIGKFKPSDVDDAVGYITEPYTPKHSFPVHVDENAQRYNFKIEHILGCVANRFSGAEAVAAYLVVILEPNISRIWLDEKRTREQYGKDVDVAIKEVVDRLADVVVGSSARSILDAAMHRNKWSNETEPHKIVDSLGFIAAAIEERGVQDSLTVKPYYLVGMRNYEAVKYAIENDLDMSILNSVII